MQQTINQTRIEQLQEIFYPTIEVYELLGDFHVVSECFLAREITKAQEKGFIIDGIHTRRKKQVQLTLKVIEL
ncbi:MAG: hypothetical protein KGI08_09375 [Thaumarchaeota archaeon]|nr:hypothetical protein [Nitrososphaerota archaeon]